MEIKGFNEHLYLLKKNHNFKKVCMNYGSDSYKEVLWAIKKPKKIHSGEIFNYHTDINCIIGEYDISVDKNIQSLYVINTMQNGFVTFRQAIDIWLELAHKTVAYNGISDDAKMSKVFSIIEQIPHEKWESFFVRFVYGFNHSQFNSFLLEFLIRISNYIDVDSISVENHQSINPQFPKICQFYDKFKFKFNEDELLFLWKNLIKKEHLTIIDSIDTHAIAEYLIELFASNEKERDTLFMIFPLMKEKYHTTNNKDNPFDFERNKPYKRFLFEFHNEQMTKNISNYSSSWSYKTFKEISDQLLQYLAHSYNTPIPQFISKDNDPIYSAIVYAESQEQMKFFRELLFEILVHYFVDNNIQESNKEILLENEYFNSLILKVILEKGINKIYKDVTDDTIDESNFKL